MRLTVILTVLCCALVTDAFVLQAGQWTTSILSSSSAFRKHPKDSLFYRRRHFSTSSSVVAPRAALVVDRESIVDVGYIVTVTRPLGVIFGENPEPFGGLVVDQVEDGLPGAMSGLRVGDQLMAIDDQLVVGESFETVMDVLRQVDFVQLQLYRGSPRQLYTILENRGASFGDEDDAEDDGNNNAVILDESYESPVRVPVDATSKSDDNNDDEKLNVQDFFNGLKVLGSQVLQSKQQQQSPTESTTTTKKNPMSGLFGGLFTGETIQLEGDDAKSTGPTTNKNKNKR